MMLTEAYAVGKSLAPFKDMLKDILKEAKSEFDDFFEKGISDYIEDRNSKIGITNTFIFRNEKVNFYETYFPLDLRSKNGNRLINSDNLLSELFQNTNCATILGMAGSGKTMLMKHAFLKCYDEVFKIPIYIELRDLNNLGVSLIEYIYSVILKNGIKPSTRILERSLESGKFLFLLDGFDEIKLEIKEKLILEIENFIDQFNTNYFIISSRPGTQIENFPRFYCYYVNPLNLAQIELFIDKQLKKIEDEELIAKLKGTVRQNQHQGYSEYLSNPLLLSMFILTFKNYPELPKTRSKFYWNVYDTLCTKHDSIDKKGGFVHQKKSNLQNDEIEQILKCFSYKTVFESKYNFDEQYLSENLKIIKDILKLDFDIKDLIYDLTVSISILIVEGLDYKFPHRTIQDYFMILFIKDRDETSKEKIYKQNFRQISPIGGNKNIYDLCLEMDKQSFYKYYLIPLFQKFLSFIHETSVIDNAIKILSEISMTYQITILNQEVTISGHSRRIVNFIDMGTFFGIEINPHITIVGNSEEQKLILELKEKNLLRERPDDANTHADQKGAGYTLIFSQLSHEIKKRFFSEYYKVQDFESFFEKMKNMHATLNGELKQEIFSNEALVDIGLKRIQ
jgi:hypothetical protein